MSPSKLKKKIKVLCLWGYPKITWLIINRVDDVNPLTPMSDQDRISPYNINTMASRQVMRIKKKILIWGLLVDPIPNSPN